MEAAGPELPGERDPPGGLWRCRPHAQAQLWVLTGGGPPAFSGPFPRVAWPYRCRLALCVLELEVLREGAECWQEGWSFQVVVGRGGLSDALT